jgi:cell division protein ZapD
MSEASSVIYEQPLNERMRAFLRLEHLFKKATDLSDATDTWSSRAALDALIDLLALVGRMDLKSELVKEMERELSALEALQSSPHIDTERLGEVLGRIRTTIESLRAADASFGQDLKSNELINAVRQRNTIPAGTCDFDLPTFRYWLEGSPEQRSQDLHRWLASFRLVHEAVDLSLSLIRSSASPVAQSAPAGFFQKTLDNSHPYVLVRVLVPVELPCFTEISAGKHRFTVRFMEQPSAEARPAQTGSDVTFKLACCGL